MATHPVSNYVVARGIEKVEGGKALEKVIQEMGGAFGRTISEFSLRRLQRGPFHSECTSYLELGRTGVHRALIERAAATQSCEAEVVEVRYGFLQVSEITLILLSPFRLWRKDLDLRLTQIERCSLHVFSTCKP